MAVRCMHEAQLHDQNCFITLTYSNSNLPEGHTLVKRDWQLFMKRLRKRLNKPVRYMHCGEYGDETLRPHYHACLFGVDFSADRYPHESKNGYTLYRSPTLEAIWGLGFVTIGELTFESAQYVARYVLKKRNTADYKKAAYQRVDPQTGEVWDVAPEYGTLSRGGRNGRGLGYYWFERFHSDVYPRDEVIVNGKVTRPPRYYDALMKERDPDLVSELKAKRQAAAEEAAVTPELLKIKAERAKIREKKRQREPS